MAPADSRTKCVLLAPPGERTDACDQLDRRGWSAQVAEAPLKALAELCLLERGRDSRRAWGHDAQDELALVVVDPPRWAQLARLVSAARRYVPTASLWSFQEGSLTPLVPEREDAGQAIASPPAGDGEPSLPDADAAMPGDDLRPPPISREEIAMLLDGELDEGNP